MSESAKVTSIEALQDFREAYLAFAEEVKEALLSMEMEARHTGDWATRDMLTRWQMTLRDCNDDLSQAKADLYRKQLQRIGGEKPDCLEERKAVRIAQARLEEAEEKLQACKQWGGHLLPRAVSEFAGPKRGLEAMVEGTPPPAVTYLDRVLDSLDAYVRLSAPAAPKLSGTTSAPSVAQPVTTAPAEPAAAASAPVGQEPAPEKAEQAPAAG